MFHSTINFLGSNGSTNYIINDQTSLNANWQTGNPYYISVDSADGIMGADISFETHELPYTTGEKSGDVFRKGAGITLTGTIWGRHLGGVMLGSSFLRQMFWDTALRKLKFYPEIGGVEAYITCRVQNDLSVAMIKPQERNYRWGWTVGLRADDPRIYKVSDNTVYWSWQT